jgi:hypothetical protein
MSVKIFKSYKNIFDENSAKISGFAHINTSLCKKLNVKINFAQFFFRRKLPKIISVR